MMPTLRQLQYVVALADTGQFVEAARQCSVSQPALSKQIRVVEDMLGIELFERARPRVLVTGAGEEIVRRSRQLLADARELVDAAGGRPRRLRLGVIPTIAPYGLPGFLAKLRTRFPEVSVAIHELQTDDVIEQLGSGQIDLGLLARPFDEHNLSGPDLVMEPFVLVAPSDHPLGVPETIELEDIEGASLILMEDGHCLRDQAIDVCALAGTPPATSVTAASVATLVRMVESGLGATLLPASAIGAEVDPDHGLIARSFGASPPGRTLTLQWRATSPSGDWFAQICEVLRDHYRQLDQSVPDIAGPRPHIQVLDEKTQAGAEAP